MDDRTRSRFSGSEKKFVCQIDKVNDILFIAAR